MSTSLSIFKSRAWQAIWPQSGSLAVSLANLLGSGHWPETADAGGFSYKSELPSLRQDTLTDMYEMLSCWMKIIFPHKRT